MPREETNYSREAKSDALYTVDHFREEIVAQLDRDGEASTDLYNDYDGGDEYHHSSHVDKAYTLLEAARLLDQLDDFEADDSGLWEGLAPKEAISAMAAYTYGNAVMSMWQDYITEINEAFKDLDSIPRGPKEWSPKKKTSPQSLEKWLKTWMEEERAKI